MRWMMFLFLMVTGCMSPSVSGSGLLLNVQPTPPSFSSSYDFDLLEPVVGRGCAQRGADQNTYWTAIPGFDAKAYDAVTNRAIGAAAYNAVSAVRGADTLLLMRVVAEGEGDRVCARVYGRGVRVRKTGVRSNGDESGAPASSDGSGEQATLDRNLIETTIQSVMGEILQCATFDHGKVRIAVTVAPTGQVTSAIVTSGPSGELGQCVANEIKKVVFPPSKKGASFSYPFVL